MRSLVESILAESETISIRGADDGEPMGGPVPDIYVDMDVGGKTVASIRFAKESKTLHAYGSDEDFGSSKNRERIVDYILRLAKKYRYEVLLDRDYAYKGGSARDGEFRGRGDEAFFVAKL